MGTEHAGPPHAPATRGLVLPRSRLAVGSTRDAHLVRRAAARRADRRAGREGSRPPGPDQGALARAPTRPAPSALPRSAFAAPARTALCACGPLAILTVPPAPLAGARRPGRAGGRVRTRARARVKPPGWCLCAASVRRVRVVLCEFTNTHAQTHTNTQARGGKCPGVDHRPAWGRGGGGRMDERRQTWRERRDHGVREWRGERALPGVPGRRTSGARGAMQAARREALGGAQTPRTCQDATSRSAVRGGQRGR